MVTPGSAEHLAAIRNKNLIRCVYCNRQLVRGATSILIHEEACPDRATVERQHERAVARFKRKQAGFA